MSQGLPGQNLLARNDSCLVVIDVQQYFLGKLPLHVRAPLVDRIAWVMRVARILDIPIIATAEDVKNDGPLVEPLMVQLGFVARTVRGRVLTAAGLAHLRTHHQAADATPVDHPR